ncbi:MAG TPA: tetratricopeptide repeat protein [Aliiroseovarius sp.]|nr:tetratricopeptide repeat protein [Aliiroseovarius sp.]
MPAVETGKRVRRTSALKVTALALGILLLGLTPYPRAFTGAMRQAEAQRAATAYGAALEAYRRAAHLDRRSPLPWQGMGEVLLIQHRFTEATAALREAERLGGGLEAILALGRSYAGRGDWAAATQTWLRAQAQAPDDARIPSALAEAATAQGQFDQARSFVTEALRLDPADRRACALAGRLALADDRERAAAWFRCAGDEDMLTVLEAVRAAPDPARADLLLGAAFLQRGKLALARRHFERRLAAAPDDAETLAYLGHTLDRQGETAAAGETLRRAVELDPDSALAYYFLGLHERLVGNLADAQAALWQAYLRDRENAALRAEMAETFVALSDYASAEEWYQGAVEVAADDIEFHLLLVHFYLDHLYRVVEGGLPAAQAAVELAPADARAHDLLGWAYYLSGDAAAGEKSLRRALELDPRLVSAHYHLGRLYAALGQRDLARDHLQRAADLDTEGFFRAGAEAALMDLE